MIRTIFNAGGDSKAFPRALGKSQAMIEYDPAGKILKSNKLFCDLLGYDLNEMTRRQHSSLLQKEYAESAEI